MFNLAGIAETVITILNTAIPPKTVLEPLTYLVRLNLQTRAGAATGYEVAAHGVRRMGYIGYQASTKQCCTWADESIIQLGYLWLFICKQTSYSERESLLREATSNIHRIGIQVANEGCWRATYNSIYWMKRAALIELEALDRSGTLPKSTSSIDNDIKALRDIGLGITKRAKTDVRSTVADSATTVLAALREIGERANSAGLSGVEERCNKAITDIQSRLIDSLGTV